LVLVLNLFVSPADTFFQPRLRMEESMSAREVESYVLRTCIVVYKRHRGRESCVPLGGFLIRRFVPFFLSDSM
jgi:hypothetical protein